MTWKLKRIAPLQAGKMLAAFYGLFSLLFVPVVLLFMTVGGFAARSQGNATPLPFMFGMGMGFIIFIPVFYAGIGFVFGIIGALVYNLLAGWIGGFEMDFEQTTQPPSL